MRVNIYKHIKIYAQHIGRHIHGFPPCPDQVHEAADDSEWRHSRLTTQEFLQRQIETGHRISQIFSVLGVERYPFRVDWLHSCDQGVGADLAGNVFEALLPKLPGANQDQRCHKLNDKLQAYYERHGVEDRIKGLQLKTFKRKKRQPAKLKGSAAQVRAIIPFVQELADEQCDAMVPKEAAIQTACRHLSHCYQALAKSSAACRDEALYSSSQAFVLQYHALHLAAGDGVAFRCKPKTHLFLELCSQPGVLPNAFWCYRDEDFGGPIARQSRMRGRWKNLTAYSGHAFDMFFMKNKVPRIVVVT